MKNKLQQYQDELAHELTSILNYWKDNTIDHDHGGFHGKIDHFNWVISDAPKGAVLNARILWTFSAAHRYTQNQDYLKIARRAFEYLKDISSYFSVLCPKMTVRIRKLREVVK